MFKQALYQNSLCKEKEADIIVIPDDVLHYHERLYTSALDKACDFKLSFKKMFFSFPQLAGTWIDTFGIVMRVVYILFSA
jgi:hypothetical protein